MDLFRFNACRASGAFTGGADGVATFFGLLDGAHLQRAASIRNSISAAEVSDGFDLADWDPTVGDAFGPGGPAAAAAMSSTDLQILDVLGLDADTW